MNWDRIVLLAGLVLGSATLVVAQDGGGGRLDAVSGTYTAQDEDGERLTLTLRVDAQGGLVGKLQATSYGFDLRGRAQGSAFECAAAVNGDPSVGLRFRGQVAGGQLALDLLDPASGAVMERIQFARQGGAPAGSPSGTPPSPAGRPVNPLGDASGQNPLAGPSGPSRAPFEGRFEGEGLVLELTPRGEGYRGSVSFAGQVMPCEARPQGAGLVGSFEAGGSAFPFEATPDGKGGLRLSSGGRTYALAGPARAAPQNLLAGGGDVATGAKSAGDPQLPVEAKHRLGVSARLPAGWTPQEFDRGVLLLPAGADPRQAEPEELHFLIAEPLAPTIRSARDPQVVAYLDQLVRGAFPHLSSSGAPQLLETAAGETALLTWSGTGPTGKAIAGRAYVAIVGQNGGAIVSVAVADKMAASEATMRAVAGSLRPFTSPMNPRLVGRWGRNGGWSASDNQTYSSSRTTLTIGHDGRFVEAYLGYVTTPAGMIESNEEKRGRWQANGATLTLQYDDGTVSSYGYSITAQGQLVCTSAGGGTCTWAPAQ